MSNIKQFITQETEEHKDYCNELNECFNKGTSFFNSLPNNNNKQENSTTRIDNTSCYEEKTVKEVFSQWVKEVEEDSK